MTDDSIRSSSDIGKLCKEFVQNIESFAETLPFVMHVLSSTVLKLDEKMNEFIENSATIVKETDAMREYSLNLEDKPTHDKLHHKTTIFRESLTITPKSFFVSLISAYDAYLGSLIKTLFYIKPELLNASNRSLTFSELVKLNTLENAQEYLVEKEVEAVLRNSHSLQFDWLEKTFSVQLRKDLKCWSKFIEATERRNLFVHVDGVISSQYISVCSEHQCVFPSQAQVGTRLAVDPNYFENATHCIAEIGIKLAHVLWRKLAPEDRENADVNLIEIIYDYLIRKNYQLAQRLADFASDTLRKYSSDETRRILIINQVISYKFGGIPEKALKLLEAEDWSSSADRFQLAVAVLRDDFEHASKIMKQIGKNSQPCELHYREWPVFEEFRKSKQFLSSYKEIFNEDFKLQEKEPKQDKALTNPNPEDGEEDSDV